MDYILTPDGKLRIVEDNELYHYGVKGMKWGIRRAQKQLRKASDSSAENRAFYKLQKHRAKGSAELAKLEKSHKKLESKLLTSSKKDAEKAAKLERKAGKYDNKAAKKMRKAGGLFTSADKAAELKTEADKLKLKSDLLKSRASTMRAKYALAKQKVETNERMQKAFRTEINNIDAIFVDRGKSYLDVFK